MFLKTPLIAAVTLVGASYAAYPCMTLYQLNSAVRSGDCNAVSRLVDWEKVREGVQEDIADEVTDVQDPQAVKAGTQLAPFGFSFMKGIAQHAVAREVTPENVVGVLREHQGHASSLALRMAYFESPTTFMVRLGNEQSKEVRLRLELEDGNWRVTRVWLPLRMLKEAGTAQMIASRAVN